MKIEENPQDRQLVGSIANLVANYGAKVCVEGIETSAMRDILLNYEVHSFQGYYYSRPIPLDDLLNREEK
jgi:EAL domain-containing protein (putative c-di-GMP-specific phosphodiesterase class I)